MFSNYHEANGTRRNFWKNEGENWNCCYEIMKISVSPILGMYENEKIIACIKYLDVK